LPLKSGGLLADTPGFGYPSLESLTVKKMTDGEYFPEIRWAKAVSVSEGISETGTCKFSNCTHRDEPGCVVDLVMPWEEERYDMYCDVFDEVSQLEKAEREAGYKRETRVRYKDGGKDKGDTTEGGKDKGKYFPTSYRKTVRPDYG
jgi:ribosome biogenesis GTPase / thiamine phosphate phosphatase